jgi:hypothetical protein
MYIVQAVIRITITVSGFTLEVLKPYQGLQLPSVP